MEQVARFSWIVLLLFLGVRYGLQGVLDSIHSYLVYGVELGFIFFWYFVDPKSFNFEFRWLKKDPIKSLLVLAWGFFTATLLIAYKINPPFDIGHFETLLFLVLIGPVIEELLFRGALWAQFDKFLKGDPVSTVLTQGALFGMSHFVAFFQTTGIIRTFIGWQTLYTVLLGMILAIDKLKYGSITRSIAIHILFNLGFASCLWLTT